MLAVVAVAIAGTGTAVGIGSTGPVGILVAAFFGALGIGLAAIVLAGDAPFDATSRRAAVGLAGAGFIVVGVCSVIAMGVTNADSPLVWIVLLGLLIAFVGTIGTGIALAVAEGRLRPIGGLLVIAVVCGVLASFLGSAGAGAIGVLSVASSILLLAGWAGVGAIAAGFGNPSTSE